MAATPFPEAESTPPPQPEGKDWEWLEKLSGPEYLVGDVRFFIDRIPAKPATPIFRRIIAELQHLDFDAIGVDLELARTNEETMGWGLLKQITLLRPEFIDWLQDQLFRYVRFQSERNSPQMLLGAEDMAFEKLTVFEVHEVLIRSLARNFFALFLEYRSRRAGASGPAPVPPPP